MMNTVNNTELGSLLYSDISYQDYQKEIRKLNRFGQLAIMILVFYILVISFLLYFISLNSELLIDWRLILCYAVPIILVTGVVLFVFKVNWFAIYSNGISPPSLPFRYVIKRKKTIRLDEIKTIEFTKDEHVDNKHIWTAVFYLQDYKFIVTNIYGEKAYEYIYNMKQTRKLS